MSRGRKRKDGARYPSGELKPVELGPTPEWLAKPYAEKHHPVVAVFMMLRDDRKKINAGTSDLDNEETACHRFSNLWARVLSRPVHPKGCLQDARGRALNAPDERKEEADERAFKAAVEALGNLYDPFREVVIQARYPYYTMQEFRAACRALVRHWRMERAA